MLRSALGRRREIPALVRRLTWQSIPPGQMFFRAILLIIAGSMFVAFSPSGSKLELLGYFLFLMSFNMTVMQFVWRGVDNTYVVLAKHFGWPSDHTDLDDK